MGYEAKLKYYVAADRVLLCITDPLEQCRFPSIRPTDNKDPEVRISSPKLCSFFPVDRYRWCYTLRSRSEHFLQVFEKTFGLLGRFSSLSHIDEDNFQTNKHKSESTSTHCKTEEIREKTQRLAGHRRVGIPEHNMKPSFSLGAVTGVAFHVEGVILRS